MFNVLLIVQLSLCVTKIAEGGNVYKQDNPANIENVSLHLSTHRSIAKNAYCEYPKEAFQILIKRQCPATHSFCVIDVPFDIMVNMRYRCATAPRRTDLTVHLMNSTQLLVQINNDSELHGGYSNCMLTAFYAPDCAFSIRMVSYLYQLPRVYPRLHIVATDARDHSKLNSRYGIIGTPTILLWVDGSVVSRMDEAPFSLKAFKNYIEKWTDLESEYIPVVEIEGGSVGTIQFHESSFDWYLWMSWCSFLPSIAYFFMNSKYGRAFWETIRTNYIQANEAQR
uniref:Thioredoxin domain-containing protein n=1 Tax=Setaria digitata TaxID=48799 RepID=A0A915PK73_9BILA